MVCKYCGEEFTSLHGAKYCSVLCHAKADAERNRAKYIPVEKRKQEKVYPPKPCVECGEPFVPRSGSARYCSPECFAAARIRRTKKYEVVAPHQPTTTQGSPESEAVRRYRKMSLREVSAECKRLHLTYGQAQTMADMGTLPCDFGLGVN